MLLEVWFISVGGGKWDKTMLINQSLLTVFTAADRYILYGPFWIYFVWIIFKLLYLIAFSILQNLWPQNVAKWYASV